MRLYTFKVFGGSPGINGQIAVLANGPKKAFFLAKEEIDVMNKVRKNYNDLTPVRIKALPDSSEKFKYPGVVYSHDGEE